MITLCCTSDNHGDKMILDKIKTKYPHCDAYLHAGDSEMMLSKQSDWLSVIGNCDFDYDLPRYRMIEINGIKILLTHSHLFYSKQDMYDLAKQTQCHVVIYGHTHRPMVEQYDDIYMINPGSCAHNRDGSLPCFMILSFDNDTRQLIDANRIEVRNIK